MRAPLALRCCSQAATSRSSVGRSPPGSTPLYCQQEPAQAKLPPRSGKIYWVVYGKDHHKPAVKSAVRKLVQQIGTDVDTASQCVSADFQTYFECWSRRSKCWLAD